MPRKGKTLLCTPFPLMEWVLQRQLRRLSHTSTSALERAEFESSNFSLEIGGRFGEKTSQWRRGQMDVPKNVKKKV